MKLEMLFALKLWNYYCLLKFFGEALTNHLGT